MLQTGIMSLTLLSLTFCTVEGANSGGVIVVPLKNPFFAMDTCTQKCYPISDIPPQEQLALVKSLGYKGMSWTLGDLNQVVEVEKDAKQLGLKIFALYAPVTLHREELSYPPTLIQAMDDLKGANTLIWLMIKSDAYSNSSPEGDKVAVKGIRELADKAHADHLRLAIYPHIGSWTERLQDALRVTKEVNRVNVGVTFNLCHCLQVGDEKLIPELLKKASPRLFMVTINGADTNAAGASWTRLIQPLGEGTFDMVTFLKELQAIGYSGPIGLQGFGLQGDIKQNLEQSMSAWRKLTGQR
jgi:sugar phosphate isomerase/epimerase